MDDASAPADDSSAFDRDQATSSSPDSASTDSLTDVTHQSWFSRIGNAIKGVLIGIVLVFIGIALLVWNESRAVTTARSLAEGRGAVVSVDAAAVSGTNEGHLVHVQGPIAATAKLEDPDFAIAVEALTLRRKVEMFQWEEHEESKTEKKLGGGEETRKTYTYTKTWSATPIDSARFKATAGHVNPQFTLRARDVAAKDAKLGGFKVSETLLMGLPAKTAVSIDDKSLPRLRERLGRSVSVLDGSVYTGFNPASPQVGDLRISFTQTDRTEATIIARQAGDGFAPYQTRAGDAIETIRAGLLSPSQIFAQLESDNNILTWILRAVGCVLILIGFALFFGPLSVLADVIPFIGDLVGFGTFAVSLMLTLVVAPLTIAIAWLAFRPLMSALILGGGIAGMLAVRFLWPKRAPKLQPGPVPHRA